MRGLIITPTNTALTDMTYNHNITEWKVAMANQLASYNAEVETLRQPVLTAAVQWQADFRMGRNLRPGRGI